MSRRGLLHAEPPRSEIKAPQDWTLPWLFFFYGTRSRRSLVVNRALPFFRVKSSALLAAREHVQRHYVDTGPRCRSALHPLVHVLRSHVEVLCKRIFIPCNFGRASENFAMDTVADHAKKDSCPYTCYAYIAS